MKKTSPNKHDTDEMRAEYDFSGGVRGKYAKALRENGYKIRIYQDDGTYTDRQVLPERTIVLEPDVWEYFPDSQSVNLALRTLISIIPEKHKSSA